jgi:hypothetical protein
MFRRRRHAGADLTELNDDVWQEPTWLLSPPVQAEHSSDEMTNKIDRRREEADDIAASSSVDHFVVLSSVGKRSRVRSRHQLRRTSIQGINNPTPSARPVALTDKDGARNMRGSR